MATLDDLSLRRIVNADGMKTGLGGTLMSSRTLDAMREGAAAFVDMWELQAAVASRIASLTQNEAALVCTGAAGGMFLSTLACLTGADERAVTRLVQRGPRSLKRREVIVQAAQSNPFLPALTLAGARLIEIGNVLQTLPADLEAAIGEETAAVFHFPGRHLEAGALDLMTVIEIAHRHEVPVVVDAAAQLPPRENLWRFTQMGADLVIFSGGKELRGPQTTGLIVGKRGLIEACAMHAAPNQHFARGMKVGKEEMLGLLAAVEDYLELDEAAERSRCEAIVAGWVARLNLPGTLTVARDFPGTDGRPLPRALLTADPGVGLSGEDMRQALIRADPPVAVRVAGPHAIYLNPEVLEPGQETVVERAVTGVLGRVPDAQASEAGVR
jgi:L-seryl-tRNA(Ser) seleniumtransferase